MRTPLLGVVAGTLVIATTASTGASLRRAPSWCAPADSWQSGLIVYLQGLVTSTDSERVAVRDSLRMVPVAASLVQAVSSDSLCALAGRTIDVAISAPVTTSRRVYLVKAGPRYWAEDTSMHVAGHQQAFVLDSTLSIVLQRVLN